jgi:hypothetical protein
MEVEIEMPNLDDDAANTMKRWMSNHPSSAVLLVLATNMHRDAYHSQFQVDNCSL